jgi:hypothetical protein
VLDRAQRGRIVATLNTDGSHRRLVVDLNGYFRELSTPNMTIDSLRVTHYMPDTVALAKLARSWYGIPSSDSLINRHETRLVPPFTDSRGASAR